MATTPLTHLFSFFTQSKPPPPQSPAKMVPSNISTVVSGANKAWDPLVLTSEAQAPPRDVMSVVCPSLAHANTMFFKSAYNVQVIVDDNEPEEKLLGRFRREVMRAGVIQECKRRRFFETKQDEKKRKTREAAKRNRRRRPPPRTGGSWDKQEASKSKKEDEDEDNWDLPEGETPY